MAPGAEKTLSSDEEMWRQIAELKNLRSEFADCPGGNSYEKLFEPPLSTDEAELLAAQGHRVAQF